MERDSHFFEPATFLCSNGYRFTFKCEMVNEMTFRQQSNKFYSADLKKIDTNLAMEKLKNHMHVELIIIKIIIIYTPIKKKTRKKIK